MLRCRILVPHTWTSGKHQSRCCNKAGFSSSPLARISPINRSCAAEPGSQSAPDADLLVGVRLSQDVFKKTSAAPKHSSNESNNISATILQAEPWLEKEGQTAGSKKATNVITEEKDWENLPSTLEIKRYLMNKLDKLRLTSRNISKAAAAAIDYTSKTSRQESSLSSDQLQDGINESLPDSDSETSSPSNSDSIDQDENSKIAKRVLPATIRKTISKKTNTDNRKTSSRHIQLTTSREKPPISYIRTTTPTIFRKFASSSQKHVKSALLTARKLQMEALEVPEQPAVKTLSYDLDRVLFKQGVYNLQDPRTGVYNFDHYLQKIMPEEEFDFDSLAEFKSSSKDTTLQSLAKERGKKYIGSTSSMTSVLSHFHFLLSNFRRLNLSRISRAYPEPLTTFTEFTRIPTSIYLKYKDGVYAVDSDKEFDRASILSRLGQSLEKLLTVPKDFYEQYRKSSTDKIPDEVKNAPETYHYSSLGKFVFRSQLDGHHEWLPGSGVFDIKTRACVTIRMGQDNYKEMSGYQIRGLYGEWESYEREYLDMLRSTMLKYSLQVRMGRMDGIFVAYHNTEQIFGFQYIPLSEMDLALHGQEDLSLGDQEFKFSVQMFSDVLDIATERFPHQSIRFHFETRPRASGTPEMYIFAEPMDLQTMDTVQQAETDIAMQKLRDEMLGEVSSSKTNGTEERVTENFEDLEEHNYATETDLAESAEQSTSTDMETIHTESELQVPVQDQDIDAKPSAHASEVAPVGERDFFDDQSKFDDLVQSVLPLLQSTDGHSKTDPLIEVQSQQPSRMESEPDKNETGESQAKQRTILGFSLTASHIIDGTRVEDVPTMSYLGEWPLQQAQYRMAKSAGAPSVNKAWNISYRIEQFSESDAQKLYRACQARKRKKYEQLYSPDEWRGKYISMMKALSVRGRNQQRAAEKIFSGNVTRQISN